MYSLKRINTQTAETIVKAMMEAIIIPIFIFYPLEKEPISESNVLRKMIKPKFMMVTTMIKINNFGYLDTYCFTSSKVLHRNWY